MSSGLSLQILLPALSHLSSEYTNTHVWVDAYTKTLRVMRMHLSVYTTCHILLQITFYLVKSFCVLHRLFSTDKKLHYLGAYSEVHEDVIKDELLYVKINHQVAVKRALESPAQRLEARDVIPHVRVAASGSSAARRYRPEHEPRLIQLRNTARPTRAALERAVIHYYRSRTRLQTLPLHGEHWIGRTFIILKSVNVPFIIHGTKQQTGGQLLFSSSPLIVRVRISLPPPVGQFYTSRRITALHRSLLELNSFIRSCIMQEPKNCFRYQLMFVTVSNQR